MASIFDNLTVLRKIIQESQDILFNYGSLLVQHDLEVVFLHLLVLNLSFCIFKFVSFTFEFYSKLRLDAV